MSKRLPAWIALALAALLVLRLAMTWAGRLTYPYDLEWMEGGMLVHAWRLQHDLSLYPAAGRDFIPYIYPPGYASLLALLGEFAPLGHPLGRVLSLAGSLAAALAAERAVRVHTGDRLAGWVAAAVFLGCYPFSGAFYDLVRLDGVAIGLLAWALVLGAEEERGAPEASALLLAAAFLVKQHAAAFGVPIAVAIALRDGWREAVRYALIAATPALVVTGFLEWRTGGTYLSYVLGVPAEHGLVGSRVLPGTPREIAQALPLALPLASVWAARRLAPAHWGWLALASAAVGAGTAWFLGGPPRLVAYGALGIAAMALGALSLPYLRGASWRKVYGAGVAATMVVVVALMRGHVGGFVNVHIPLHWVVAVGGGFALAGWSRPWLYATVAGAQILWLASAVDPRLDPRHDDFLVADALDPLVPTDADRAVGDEVVSLLRDIDEPVLSPYAPWLLVQAGHEPSFHLIALWDVDHRGGPWFSGAQDVRRAVREGYWGTIVDGTRAMKYGTDTHYRRKSRLPTSIAFAPRTGWPAKPAALLVPNDDAAEGAGAPR